MSYILMVIIFSGGANIISMQEFDTEAHCQSAANFIGENLKYNGIRPTDAKLTCLPK